MTLNNSNTKKHLFFFTVCLCSLLSGPINGYAAPEEVMAKIEKEMTDTICAGGGKWLECYNKDPGKCSSYAKAIVRPCVEEQLKYVDSGVSLESALQYAVEMKNCFNRAVPGVLGEQKDTKDCKEMRPAHLW